MRAVRDAAPARLQPSPQPRIGRAGEPQVAPGSDGSLNCHGYGSSVTVTATFGLCAAGWVLQQLVQRAVPAASIAR